MAAVIRIEVQGSGGGVQEVKKDVQDLGETAEKAGGGFSAMREIATGALRAIGEGAVGLAVKGIQAVTGAISDGIEDAKNYAIIAAQTEAVIKSTGGAAGVSAEHVADYASALSDAAGASLFGDDQIQQSTNLLLTFTEIKGTVLDAATAISVDMAQAMGGEPKDAAIQLGKALNDPIKGITALTRVGVTFTEEQKAQIQAMQEAGDMAGAQNVILAELNKEFGGSAKAAADATGGWSEFNGRMGEAKETMGAAVLPLLNMLAGVLTESVLPVVEAAAQGFADFIAAFQVGVEGGDFLDGIINGLYRLGETMPIFNQIGDIVVVLATYFDELLASFNGVGGGASLITDALNALPAVIATVMAAWDGLQPSLQVAGQTFTQLQSTIDTVMQGIMAVVAAILPQIMAFWQAHGADILATITDTWNRINAIIQTALQLISAIVGPALQFIASFISSHGAEIQALLTNTWNAIKAGIDIALTFIQGVLKAALQIIQGDWSGAWETIKTMCARIVQDLITIIEAGVGNIKTLFGGLVENVISIISGLANDAVELGGNIIQGIIDGVSNGVGALVDAVSNAAQSALDAAMDLLGIGSPSKVFADEVGEPIVQGIIVGIQGMIPGLTSILDGVAAGILSHVKKLNDDVVNEAHKIQDDLIAEAEGIADKLSGVMADAMTGTASLDRAKARAIANLKDISASQQEDIQARLTEAANAAAGFADPKQAAAFFKMRSDQIFELAKLRDKIEEETDEAAKARLIEQYNLIGRAQQSELQAFDTRGAGKSPLADITEKLTALLSNSALPGVFDDPTGIIGQLFAALPQLIAMTTGGGPSAYSSSVNSAFTYSPTINTTGGVNGGIDYSTARALAGI